MSGQRLVLPMPTGDLREWAQQLIAVLQVALSNNELGGTSLPIYDVQGRPIVTQEGVYAYDASGNAPIAPNIVQIDTDHLVDAAITTQKLATRAVDVDRLADLAVTAAKLADRAVTSTKLEDGAVTSLKIANEAVGYSAIAQGAIGTAHIGNGVIVNAHIGDAEIQDAKIANLGVNKLLSGAISSAVIDILDPRFRIDSPNQLLQISDANNVVRVKLGKLGPNAGDYGIEIYDGGGNLIFASGRVFDSSMVDALLTQNAPAEAGATNGAQLGTNLKDSSGTVRGDADFAASFNPITSGNVSTFIANAAIGAAQIGTAQIQNAHLDRASVNKIQIVEADIVDAAITSAKIADAAITNAKLDRASANKIQIDTADIVDLAVQRIKIADGAVNTILKSVYSSTAVPVGNTGSNYYVDVSGPTLPSSVLAPYVILSFDFTVSYSGQTAPSSGRFFDIIPYWPVKSGVSYYRLYAQDGNNAYITPDPVGKVDGATLCTPTWEPPIVTSTRIFGALLLPFVANAVPRIRVWCSACGAVASSLPVSGEVVAVLAEK